MYKLLLSSILGCFIFVNAQVGAQTVTTSTTETGRTTEVTDTQTTVSGDQSTTTTTYTDTITEETTTTTVTDVETEVTTESIEEVTTSTTSDNYLSNPGFEMNSGSATGSPSDWNVESGKVRTFSTQPSNATE